MGRKSKKIKAAEKAGMACRNALGDDKLCDKIMDKALAAPGPTYGKRKKGE
jgi:hypothetical protein